MSRDLSRGGRPVGIGRLLRLVCRENSPVVYVVVAVYVVDSCLEHMPCSRRSTHPLQVPSASGLLLVMGRHGISDLYSRLGSDSEMRFTPLLSGRLHSVWTISATHWRRSAPRTNVDR